MPSSREAVGAIRQRARWRVLRRHPRDDRRRCGLAVVAVVAVSLTAALAGEGLLAKPPAAVAGGPRSPPRADADADPDGASSERSCSTRSPASRSSRSAGCSR